MILDWRGIITKYHDAYHDSSERKLVIGDGATARELDWLQEWFGYGLPEEFRSLYRCCNGYGYRIDTSDDVGWFFLPIACIPEFATGVRNWFEPTHPALASRFLPFIDWVNGDGMGVLVDESGKAMEGLFNFEHESYRFEEGQQATEFLELYSHSISEFLSDGVGMEHVIVEFVYTATDAESYSTAVERIRSALLETGTGEYRLDDTEYGEGDCAAILSGPDAESLFRTIEPILRELPMMHGANVRLIFGSLDDECPERLIEL